jgi:hypothetical protein
VKHHARSPSRIGLGGLERRPPGSEQRTWSLIMALMLTIVLAVALYTVAPG